MRFMATDDVAISMTWASWKVIDANMDNTGSIAAENGDAQVAERASAIREVGWEATGHIDRPYMDRGEWPPPAPVHSEPVTVSLSREDWGFVLDELGRWSDVSGGEPDEKRTLVVLINEALSSD